MTFRDLRTLQFAARLARTNWPAYTGRGAAQRAWLFEIVDDEPVTFRIEIAFSSSGAFGCACLRPMYEGDLFSLNPSRYSCGHCRWSRL